MLVYRHISTLTIQTTMDHSLFQDHREHSIKYSLTKCCLGEGIPTLSCHRGSGKSCLGSVHLGRLCVQFLPTAGSSVRLHLLRNAQIHHLNVALKGPPLCFEYCPCEKKNCFTNNPVTGYIVLQRALCTIPLNVKARKN